MPLRVTSFSTISYIEIILSCSSSLRSSFFFPEYLLHTKYVVTVENLLMSEKDKEKKIPEKNL